jgi:starch-binding outer membrane protein, SusD/RagB family
MKLIFYIHRKINVLSILFSFVLFSLGCKKFIEVNSPSTSVNGKNVYVDDANAIAAVTGIYAKLSSSNFSLNLSIYPELSADNYSLYTLENDNFTLYYQNSLTANYRQTTEFWSSLYNYIYLSNAAITGLTSSSGLTPIIKKQLLGETHFLRAFFYFYLYNLYGSVPLALSTDFENNNHLSRSDSVDVYKQILSDLNIADTMLGDKYLDASLVNTTNERVRPNRYAAKALMSRVYLYIKDYEAAEACSSILIDTANLYTSQITIGEVFLKNSSETIWSLQPVRFEVNTDEAAFYTPVGSELNGVKPVYISSGLKAAYEANDLRKNMWIDSISFNGEYYSYPAKYKTLPGTTDLNEYPVVLRLAEQYLVRAEARAALSDVSGSQNDINIIRRRAGLPDIAANTINDLFTAVIAERRVELFSEWGNRWFDLKRTGLINSVMGSASQLKGGVWDKYKSLFPIPSTEIIANGHLNQNVGYN